MIIARQDGKSMLTLSKLLNGHSNQNRYQRQTRELILSSTQKDGIASKRKQLYSARKNSTSFNGVKGAYNGKSNRND